MKAEIQEVKIVRYPDGRLDTANAARFLGLSPKTLAIWRSAGSGPPFIKRGRIFYYEQDLRVWLAEHPRTQSTAQCRALRIRSLPKEAHSDKALSPAKAPRPDTCAISPPVSFGPLEVGSPMRKGK